MHNTNLVVKQLKKKNQNKMKIKIQILTLTLNKLSISFDTFWTGMNPKGKGQCLSESPKTGDRKCFPKVKKFWPLTQETEIFWQIYYVKNSNFG